MNISGVTGISVILDADIDINTGDFLRGKLIAAQQTGYGIPEFDETGEGFKLVCSLTDEDFPKHDIIFTEAGGIYNNRIIPLTVRPREEYTHSFRFKNKKAQPIKIGQIHIRKF
jgi:hypothetical protein